MKPASLIRQSAAILRLEALNLLRSNIHWVLLITLVAIIALYYLLPADAPQSLLADALLSEPNAPTESPTPAELVYIGSAQNESLRSSLLPVMLAFEVSILGFLFIAVGMFQENEEGIHRALRSSPLYTLAYILSKLALWALISLAYGAVMSLATLRLAVNYLQLLLLIISQTIILSSIGLIIAVSFRNLSDWFIPGVSILVINMLPILSLRIQGFDPLVFRLIPGYYAIQHFTVIVREGSADVGFPLFIATSFLVACLLVAASWLAVNRKLMRGR